MSYDQKYELQQFVFPKERLTIRKMIEFELLKHFCYLSLLKEQQDFVIIKKRSTVSKRDGFRFVGFKRAYR